MGAEFPEECYAAVKQVQRCTAPGHGGGCADVCGKTAGQVTRPQARYTLHISLTHIARCTTGTIFGDCQATTEMQHTTTSALMLCAGMG
jgi:hypothetical protein